LKDEIKKKVNKYPIMNDDFGKNQRKKNKKKAKWTELHGLIRLDLLYLFIFLSSTLCFLKTYIVGDMLYVFIDSDHHMWLESQASNL